MLKDSSINLSRFFILKGFIIAISTLPTAKANDLKLQRETSGVNANSQIIHPGTGTLEINAQNAGNINLKTDNTTRMTITSSGNIGIGTTNPQYALDVNGHVRIGCPSGMLDSGAGYCIDASDSSESAYGSSIASCASVGKLVCSFQQLCTAKERNVGSLGNSYRVADLMFWNGNSKHYLGGSNNASISLYQGSSCNGITKPGPHGGTLLFRCCRNKG